MGKVSKEVQALLENPFFKEMFEKAARQSKAHGHSFEYLEGALDQILISTRAKLTAEERIVFLAKLSVFSRQRLRTLFDYTGFIGGVWKYLDEVSAEDYVSARSEIGYSNAKKDLKQIESKYETNIEMSKDFGDHFRLVASFIGNREKTPEIRLEQLRAENKSWKRLQEKYPNAGVEEVLREDRFHNLDDEV